MIVTITMKIKLTPDEEQEKLLVRSSQLYAGACNHISEWVNENKTLSVKKINDALYREVREKFSLPSQMAQSAIRTVVSKYKTVHASNKKWSITPHFRRSGIDYVWNRDYSLNRKTGNFSVNSVGGRIKVTTTWSGNEDFRDCTYGSAILRYKHGKWILHVPVDISVDDVDISQIANIVGVDMGINFLATTYNSSGKTTFHSGKSVKDRRAHYKHLRTQLQKKNTRSSKSRLKKIGSRENRWMNDVNHVVSKALVKSAGKHSLIVLEDLAGIRNATEKVRKNNRYVSVSWAFYDLRKKIEYKAALNGCLSIAIDPAYTSQTCPKCGHVSKNNRDKKRHQFTCTLCGYTSNDDRIAAMNLHNKGIQYRMQCYEGTPL